MALAPQDPALAALLRGVVMRQARSVLLDPYANAFNIAPNGAGHQEDPRTPRMTPGVFEGKYETDSLAAVLRSSSAYFNATGDASLLDEADWLGAMEAILDTLTAQQRSTAEDGAHPAYTFGRPGEVYPKKGAPANRTGLSKCGFRPSDDETGWPFLISANAMAAVELGHLADIAASTAGCASARSHHCRHRLAAIGKRAAALSAELRAAIHALAPQKNKDATIYAYEIDGFGNHRCVCSAAASG